MESLVIILKSLCKKSLNNGFLFKVAISFFPKFDVSAYVKIMKKVKKKIVEIEIEIKIELEIV